MIEREHTPHEQELTPRDKLVFLRQNFGETITNASLRQGKLELLRREHVSQKTHEVLLGNEPDDGLRKRIDFIYDIYSRMLEVDQQDVVDAWLQGMNPDLDNASPLRFLEIDPERVKKAAEKFILEG